MPIRRPEKERVLYSLIYATRQSAGIKVLRKIQVETLLKQEDLRATLRRAQAVGEQSEVFPQTEMGKTEVERYIRAERLEAGRLLVALTPVFPDHERYAIIWPRVLAKHAITRSELNKIAAHYRKEGRLNFPDWPPRRRVPSDDDRVSRCSKVV